MLGRWQGEAIASTASTALGAGRAKFWQHQALIRVEGTSLVLKTRADGPGCWEGDSNPKHWTGRNGWEGAWSEDDMRQQ